MGGGRRGRHQAGQNGGRAMSHWETQRAAKLAHKRLLADRDEALRKAKTQGILSPGWHYWTQAAYAMERLLKERPFRHVHDWCATDVDFVDRCSVCGEERA